MQVRLADHGKTLATRPLAAKLRDGVHLPSDEVIELDFEDVLAVSYSFADEFLGRLAASTLESGGPKVSVLNASDEVRSVLERALEHRGVGEAVRITTLA